MGWGVEAVYIPNQGWVLYGQKGPGLGVPGGGASLEVGVIKGLNDPEQYTGPFVEIQGGGGFLSGSAFGWPTGPSGIKAGGYLGTPGAGALAEDYFIYKDFTK